MPAKPAPMIRICCFIWVGSRSEEKGCWLTTGVILPLAWIKVLIHYCLNSLVHFGAAMPPEKSPPQVVFLPLGTPEPGVSLQRWLYEALRGAILGGRLPAGRILLIRIVFLLQVQKSCYLMDLE